MTNAQRSGVYVYLFEIADDGPVKVGALGTFDLRPGTYAYVGSAKSALDKRLARHRRKRKPKRWHIDYLARRARPIGAGTWSWRTGRECRLAECVRGIASGQPAIPGFGASDCSCRAHLFRIDGIAPETLVRRLSDRIGEAGTLESYPRPKTGGRNA